MVSTIPITTTSSLKSIITWPSKDNLITIILTPDKKSVLDDKMINIQISNPVIEKYSRGKHKRKKGSWINKWRFSKSGNLNPLDVAYILYKIVVYVLVTVINIILSVYLWEHFRVTSYPVTPPSVTYELYKETKRVERSFSVRGKKIRVPKAIDKLLHKKIPIESVKNHFANKIYSSKRLSELSSKRKQKISANFEIKEVIVFRLISINALPKMDIMGSCDPYFKLGLWPEAQKIHFYFQSDVSNQTQCPIYFKRFKFSPLPVHVFVNNLIEFKIFDHDMLSADDPIGAFYANTLCLVPSLPITTKSKDIVGEEIDYLGDTPLKFKTNLIEFQERDKLAGEVYVRAGYLEETRVITLKLIIGRNIQIPWKRHTKISDIFAEVMCLNKSSGKVLLCQKLHLVKFIPINDIYDFLTLQEEIIQGSRNLEKEQISKDRKSKKEDPKAKNSISEDPDILISDIVRTSLIPSTSLESLTNLIDHSLHHYNILKFFSEDFKYRVYQEKPENLIIKIQISMKDKVIGITTLNVTDIIKEEEKLIPAFDELQEIKETKPLLAKSKQGKEKSKKNRKTFNDDHQQHKCHDKENISRTLLPYKKWLILKGKVGRVDYIKEKGIQMGHFWKNLLVSKVFGDGKGTGPKKRIHK
ncbi:unnamed protein product [Gordionus sp. m RMFG-2023]